MSLTFSQARDEIAQLVAQFRVNHSAYLAPSYKEAHARQQLIDPLFMALGWDVHNTQKAAPDYTQVVFEDSLTIGGNKRAPDYTFRIGKHDRKFFVEAKKPGVPIKNDADAAYQIRLYGWNAKLPLSILTDFEEFAVYDCRNKPKPTDKPAVARVDYYTYEEYVDRWQELWERFSYEAVVQGKLDHFIESVKGKRSTLTVDADFLDTIEQWRKLLAQNLALRNEALDVPALNDAVQRTLDRLIFMRIAEDRDIEPYEQLKDLAPHDDLYKRLVKLFKQADDKYNSGLFDFAHDTRTPKLKIDDKVLRAIIGDLYGVYNFRIMPPDILGNVYEQFLGKVIHLTPSHQARVEEKPAVRKAGGVYYTPSYIVDYIVQHTVGKWVEGKTPNEVSHLRVLDMACGSGSFLLGAYQFLLDWHLQWYVTDQSSKFKVQGSKSSPIVQQHDTWRLTTEEKKRILLNNIFGVDIDRQAVEVTKLSLLLKVLEGESQASLQMAFNLGEARARALPNLDDNIKCGNSLIGTDYFTGQMLPDPDELQRVNAFDWEREFPQVFAADRPARFSETSRVSHAGGFDCVIGNPPWGAELPKEDEKYIRSVYAVAQTSALDSYALFIERAMSQLKPSGLLGYITPDTFLRKQEFLATRSFLLQKTSVCELVEAGPLFSKVRDTWCLVSIASNNPPTEDQRIKHRKLSRFITSVEERLERFGKGEWSSEAEVPQSTWLSHPKLIVGYSATEQEQTLVAKLEKWPSIGEQSDLYKISRGEEGSKFALTPHTSGKFWMVIPENVERHFVDEGMCIAASTLTPTKVTALYQHSKIWIIRIQKLRWGQRIVCAFDGRTNSAGMKTLQVIISPNDDENNLKYLSGILASRLINFWCVNYLADDINQSYLEKIPIRTINISDAADQAQHDRMVQLVTQMLELHKHLHAAPSDAAREIYQRQIDATDRAIDALVYELYGLTEEEIAIVEETQ
jgi:type I restriction-modification system DNA methylase subunit